MMKSIVVTIVLGSLASVANAHDSLWLMCKSSGNVIGDVPIAVSVFESRSASGDSRDLSVTLIAGDHVARGVISNHEAGVMGALTLVDIDNKTHKLFVGTGTLDDANKLSLAGKVDENLGAGPTSMVKLQVKLACDLLRD